MRQVRVPVWLSRGQGRWVLLLVGAMVALFLLFDLLFPLPLAGTGFSSVIAARDGSPLRAFPSPSGTWRYPTTPDAVSPLYLEALLGYEDRWFHVHPGVNPVALMRALWQGLVSGRAVSGGSTLTMQVARILEPHPRTVTGKLRQIVRALQLEWHFSKAEILALYLNRAPFGGVIEGVEAAAHAYLGKSARELSHAEAALLAVLPQSPSRLRPDRHPDAAEQARDKVLTRLERQGRWSAAIVAQARQERVSRHRLTQPQLAPLLAERLRPRAGESGLLRTTIDPALQWGVENLLDNAIGRLPEKSSAAALVVENESLAVLAYAGTARFADSDRFGHIDMVRATRSPGSTLKPFLYGFSLDEGMIHSESLLVDAPHTFGNYRPENFDLGFHGPVSVTEALQRSLNIPAVDLLERFGPERFVAWLRHGGLRLRIPGDGKPNLAVILGGAGSNLESLVRLYAALGRGGRSGALRFAAEDPRDDRRLLSPGAAWIVREMLATAPRRDRPELAGLRLPSRPVAWKTGTSYGYRDAWAVGVTEGYTLGVWVGRPDGTPMPGHYGAATAAPLLFALVENLPQVRADWTPPPATVSREEICWPLGTAPRGDDDPLCHRRRTAWVLDRTVPTTLPDRLRGSETGNPVTFWVHGDSGLRVDGRCPAARREKRSLALWPTLARPWLDRDLLARSRLPEPDPACPGVLPEPVGGFTLVGLEGEMEMRVMEEAPLRLTASAVGGGVSFHWLVNGRYLATTASQEVVVLRLATNREHEITVFDGQGRTQRSRVYVRRAPDPG